MIGTEYSQYIFFFSSWWQHKLKLRLSHLSDTWETDDRADKGLSRLISCYDLLMCPAHPQWFRELKKDPKGMQQEHFLHEQIGKIKNISLKICLMAQV